MLTSDSGRRTCKIFLFDQVVDVFFVTYAKERKLGHQQLASLARACLVKRPKVAASSGPNTFSHEELLFALAAAKPRKALSIHGAPGKNVMSSRRPIFSFWEFVNTNCMPDKGKYMHSVYGIAVPRNHLNLFEKIHSC
jgi:hypothetical protein